MALVFMDSFDHYATDDRLKKWDREGGYVWGSNIIASTLQRRAGTKYLWISRSHHISKDVRDTVTLGPITTFVIAAAIYLGGPDIYGIGDADIILTNAAGTQLFRLRANGNDGKLSFYIGTTLVEETASDFLNVLKIGRAHV